MHRASRVTEMTYSSMVSYGKIHGYITCGACSFLYNSYGTTFNNVTEAHKADRQGDIV